MLNAGAGTQSNSQSGSQRSERFYNKNMVVCFGTGISFGSLAEVLNKEGYWSDVIGYQKVDLTEDLLLSLIENGINVAGVHIDFAYHRKRRTLASEFMSPNYQSELI